MSDPDPLVRLAGFGLHPPGAWVTEAPLDDPDWARLLAGVGDELLGGLAQRAADAGALPVTPSQRAELDEVAAAARGRRDRATRCAAATVGRLQQAAIDVRLLQGAATARLDYPSTDRRLYHSVHLLVPPARLGDAVDVLQASGTVPSGVVRGRRSRLVRGARLVDPSGVTVELHRTLALGSYGARIDPAELFAGAVRCPGADGGPVLALDAELRFLGACLRARLDRQPPRLLAMRDVVQVALGPGLDLARVERLATSWDIEAVVADAVRRAWALFAVPDVVPLSAWAAAYLPSRRDRRRLAWYGPGPGDPSAAVPMDVAEAWTTAGCL